MEKKRSFGFVGAFNTHGQTQIMLFLSLYFLFGIFALSNSAKKKYCLIVSVDNRKLLYGSHENHYPSMAAVLNHHYANFHGYDYVYVQNEINNFVESVYLKFSDKNSESLLNQNSILEARHNTKDMATSYHVGLKQFRAASWAKLPAIWHIVKNYGHLYENIWYIDSDAAISPFHLNKSLENTFQNWSKSSDSVLHGQKDVTKSSLVFFNNFPWRDDMPCAGMFIMRTANLPLLRELVLQWWDYDIPSKNFKHFHEQDALWHMIEHSRMVETNAEIQSSLRRVRFHINSSTFSIVSDQQFPSSWTRFENLWIVHISAYNFHFRNPIFHHLLHLVKADSTEKFYNAIHHIVQNHIEVIAPLDTCIEMEAESLKIQQHHRGNRVSRFPPHNEHTQAQFYDAHISSKQVPQLSLVEQYEGRLIRKKGEFWVVQHGLKRGFPSYDVFQSMDLREDWAFLLRPNDLSQIPTGNHITGNISKEDKADVLRYYYPPNYSTVAELYLVQSNTDSHLANDHHQSSSQISGYGNYGLSFHHGRASRNESIGSCEKHERLEQLVESDDTRSMLYIICHDHQSEEIAVKFISCKDNWMKPLLITNNTGNKFFESIIYESLLNDRKLEWEDKDYVITATYKTISRSLHYNSYTQSLSQIYEYLLLAKTHNYDIVPFLRSGSGLISFTNYWHGKSFREAWDQLLVVMGYSMEIIRQYYEIKPFYRNIFIMKTKVLQELIIFMQKAIHIAKNDRKVVELLSKDARYSEGTSEAALKTFGTSYYQLYPFIFERLPSFFIFAHNYTICASSDKHHPCRYNS